MTAGPRFLQLALVSLLLGAVAAEAETGLQLLAPSLIQLDAGPALATRPERVMATAFGYDPRDATAAVQAAIDSNARKVVLSPTGQPWRLRSLRLRSRQELVMEPGVMIQGLADRNRGPLFRISDASDVILRGHQTLIEGAGHTALVQIQTSRNVSLVGLVLRGGEGDGIRIEHQDPLPCPQNIYLKSLRLEHSGRNGLYVAGAENLLVADVVFLNAGRAGLLIQPEAGPARLSVRVRNGRFQDNRQAAVRMDGRRLTELSPDLSLLFANCLMSSRTGLGAELAYFQDEGPAGLIEFKDCIFLDLAGPGVSAESVSTLGPTVRFHHCLWRRTASSMGVPVKLSGKNPAAAKTYGNLVFQDALIEDDQDRPSVAASEAAESRGCSRLSGRVRIANPYGAQIDLGPKAHANDLEVVDTLATDERPAFPAAAPLSVYPNPVRRGKLFFNFAPPEVETVWIRLFNSAGEVVLNQTETIAPGLSVVACGVQHLAAGMYLYLVQEGGRWWKGKVGIANS